jgi:hypothetical protein
MLQAIQTHFQNRSSRIKKRKGYPSCSSSKKGRKKRREKKR